MKELNEGKIKTAIFDMDGTIYQLDGDNCGFKNSSLQKHVRVNTIKFIAERENLSLTDAEKIVDELSNNKIFFSVYVSEKYGITRKDYFDIVWNIDPNSIVVNYEEAVEVIRKLADKGIELILLTQAPNVWQNNVFTFLNLTDVFSEIHTGENYMHKKEMFPEIAKTHPPQTVIAIGDQQDTDIDPAVEQGFYTFLVSSPRDLLQLLEYE